jgi:ABC-type multidrug transport system ATPase subunit
MDEAERCHRVGLVHHGRLLLEGEPRELARGFASFEALFLSRIGAGEARP